MKKKIERAKKIAEKMGEKKARVERMKTGIPGLDEMIEGGFPKKSSVLVSGGPGTGKTIFCLQSLYSAARAGKEVLYISLEEQTESLRNQMENFGADITKYEITGSMRIKEMSPVEVATLIEKTPKKGEEEEEGLSKITDGISDMLGKRQPDIVVFDSLSALESSFSKPKNYRVLIENLFKYCKSQGITAFYVTETEQLSPRFSRTGVEEFLADGVFVLYNFKLKDKRVRAFEILKMRGTKHSTRIVPLSITSTGIVIHPGESVYEIGSVE